MSDKHSDFEAYGIDQMVLADMAGSELTYEELVEAVRESLPYVLQAWIATGDAQLGELYERARALLARIEGEEA